MTELKLVRDDMRPTSCEGKLTVDGAWAGETLERPWLNNVPQISCIPAGRYRMSWKWSPHFQRNMPHIDGVQGRDYVMIHPANWPSQLHGCVAVGSVRGKDAVFHSGDTFKNLASVLEPIFARGEQVWITIVDGKEEHNGSGNEKGVGQAA